MDERDAVFVISVASRLVDLHPSTLRKYERCGLLEPCRLSGRLRLYSPEDIVRLWQIKTLVEEQGVNLAGVELALALTERVRQLRQKARAVADGDKLRQEVEDLTGEMLKLLGTSRPITRGQGTSRDASADAGPSTTITMNETSRDRRNER